MLDIVGVQRQVEEARAQARRERIEPAAKGGVARERGRHRALLAKSTISLIAAEARDAAHSLGTHVGSLAVFLAARAGGHVEAAVEHCHHLGVTGHAAVNAAADDPHK